MTYSSIKLTFVETPLFSRLLREYLDDEGYRRLQLALLTQPEKGELMPGTGGFRKLRFQDEQRGKGKRSGLRVIYYFLSDDAQVWLFTIYDKDEAVDLTANEKRILKRTIQQELSSRRTRR